MKINNNYDIVDGDYYLPVTSTVEYYIKDAKLSKSDINGVKLVINVSNDGELFSLINTFLHFKSELI